MGIRQTTGIVPAIGGGHEVTVVEAIGNTADESDVTVHVEIVAVDILGRSELNELHLRGLVSQSDAVSAEALLFLVVDGESAKGSYGVLVKSAIVGNGALAPPQEITGGTQAEAVTSLSLTNLGTAGAETLGVRVVHVNREQ